MKWLIVPFAALSMIVSSHCDGAQSKPDLGHLNGIPLGASEEQILNIFERISPPPPVKVNPNGRQPLFDPNAGLTPMEVRASVYGAQFTDCEPIGGSPTSQRFVTNMGVKDRAVSTVVSFKEVDPDRSCSTVVTSLASDQSIEGSTLQAREASEDEFFKAAIAAYGKPTVYTPRHIGDVVNNHFGDNALGTFNNVLGGGNNAPIAPTTEKHVIEPIAMWCDVGSVADCRSGGPSVDRRLLLHLNLANDEPYVEVELEDFQAERRISATITHASVAHTKPQLFEQSKSSNAPKQKATADNGQALGAERAETKAPVAIATPHVEFTVISAWVDRSPTSYYIHDTLQVSGGSTGVTIDAAMFVLPVALAGGLTSNVSGLTVAAPKFNRFDPSTNAQKLVPTVDPTEDLGVLGTVSIAAGMTGKVTVTFKVDGTPADAESTRDQRNVKLRSP